MYAWGTERRQGWLGHIIRQGFGTYGSFDWLLRDVYYRKAIKKTEGVKIDR